VLETNLKIIEDDVCVIPTCVDYTNLPSKSYTKKVSDITFGWIGTPGNYHLLDNLLPIFEKLAIKFKFNLLVIGGNNYSRSVNFPIKFVQWSLMDEVENLYSIDIGLMPLLDDLESKGKGGFKLIQYMGLGIVSVASPITINKEIVDDSVDSFLANSTEEWMNVFSKILEQQYDLREMGIRAKLKIDQKFSFMSNKDEYVKFIKYIRNR
jgi:glycosyltransferase involved in cell wall biosynthesis